MYDKKGKHLGAFDPNSREKLKEAEKDKENYMSDDVAGIVRIVAGYNKIPDEDGNQFIEVQYKLKPLKLTFLQQLFRIDPNDSDPVVTDLIDCYWINDEQAKALQPYVIDGVIDLDKYDFTLECYAASEND